MLYKLKGNFRSQYSSIQVVVKGFDRISYDLSETVLKNNKSKLTLNISNSIVEQIFSVV